MNSNIPDSEIVDNEVHVSWNPNDIKKGVVEATFPRLEPNWGSVPIFVSEIRIWKPMTGWLCIMICRLIEAQVLRL